MLGGTDDELRLVAVGLEALAERLEVTARRAPPLLDVLRGQLVDWRCLEWTSGRGGLDLGECDVVMTPLLLTRGEAAFVLRLSERQVARVVAEGRLRAVHEGSAVRFRREDLEEYVAGLAGQEKETTT